MFILTVTLLSPGSFRQRAIHERRNIRREVGSSEILFPTNLFCEIFERKQEKVVEKYKNVNYLNVTAKFV